MRIWIIEKHEGFGWLDAWCFEESNARSQAKTRGSGIYPIDIPYNINAMNISSTTAYLREHPELLLDEEEAMNRGLV